MNPRPRIVPLSKPPVQQKERDLGESFDLGDILSTLKVKGVKGDMPVKGVDYFTKEEIDAWLKAVTPKKGKHYFDGEKGERGEASTIPGPKGEDGQDADEDMIVEKVLARIPAPKDGKDAEAINLDAFKEEMLSEISALKGKKIGLKDVSELENRLNQLSAKVEKNYGGHGGTLHNIKTTLVSGGTYNLASPYPIVGEMEVYVGGGRLFFENQDYTTTQVGGNRVTQIILSLAAQADITEGAILNIRGK